MVKIFAGVLLTFFLTVGLTIPACASEPDQEAPVTLPDDVMEQVVSRILKWKFKPGKRPTQVYLSADGIKKSWLPSIKNIEFRLILIDPEDQNSPGAYSFDPEGIYFFTPLELEDGAYRVGLGLGDPGCNAFGATWSFRVPDRKKVRLWRSGGFGSGCSGSSVTTGAGGA